MTAGGGEDFLLSSSSTCLSPEGWKGKNHHCNLQDFLAEISEIAGKRQGSSVSFFTKRRVS